MKANDMLNRQLLGFVSCAVACLMPSLCLGQTSIVVDRAEVRIIYEIEVAAQADGLIQNIFVDEGHTVAPKQKVIEIDSRVEAANVAVATTELAAAELAVAQMEEVDYARATYEVARDEFLEMERLEQDNAASFAQVRRAKLEEVKSSLAVDAKLAAKKQENMAVEVAKQKLRAAQVRLEMYTMLAPMEGIITERMRDPGEWIRAGEPVFKMVHLNEMRVEALVPVFTTQTRATGPTQPVSQRERATVSPSELNDALMRITVHVSPTYKPQFEARVEYVSPVIDVDSVKVWAKIPNQRVGDGPWLLSDGMIATVEIVLP